MIFIYMDNKIPKIPKLTIILVCGYNVACIDKLPEDFSVTDCEGWKCSDMASKGPKNYDQNYCDDYWADYRHCVPRSNGRVKDYCKASCNNCGKLLRISFALLRYFIKYKL